MKVIALVDFDKSTPIKEIEAHLKSVEAVVLENKGHRYIIEVDPYEYDEATVILYYLLEGAEFPGRYEFEIMMPEHYEGIDMISVMPEIED